MSRVALALRYHDFGTPEEVLKLERVTLPSCRPGEVVVRMEAAPIHPADLNVLEGTYPLRDDPPAVPGIEGCGVIEASGPGVPRFKTGQRVIAPGHAGTWCSHRILPEKALVAVPPQVTPEQAAMLCVNPPTAWRMLHDVTDLTPGAWVIQNAANSGVGRAVIQLAASMKLRTVNLVRRQEAVAELEECGGDVVLVDGPDTPHHVREATGGEPIFLGLNAVGGEAALRTMTRCLAADAHLVTYGAMSREAFVLSNGAFLFKNLTARGFWISHWLKKASPRDLHDMMSHLLTAMRQGLLQVPVEACYPLEQWPKALAHAAQSGRSGKVLFRCDP